MPPNAELTLPNANLLIRCFHRDDRDSRGSSGRGRESGGGGRGRSNVGRPMEGAGDRSFDFRSSGSSERSSSRQPSSYTRERDSRESYSGSSQSTVGLGSVSNSRFGGGSSSAAVADAPPRSSSGFSRPSQNYNEEEEEEAGVIVAGRNRGSLSSSSFARPAPPPMSMEDDEDDDEDDYGDREEEEGSRGRGRSSDRGDRGGAWGRDVERTAARAENGDFLTGANTIRDEIQGEVLYGVNPVQAAFRCDR